MFCPSCGKENPDGAAFCGGCGFSFEKVVPQAAPVAEAPVAPVAAAPVAAAPVAPVQPVYAAPEASAVGDDSLAKSIMTMGIVSIVFACTFWLSLVGIIFGAIGLSKAKKFTEQCGQLYGKAKVGRYLSLGGLIGSCVMGAIAIIYILIMVIAIVGSAASYY